MSTEHEQPTQEQIDAALAITSLVPIKREMTSPEIDAWFSARDAVSAHARLGETNVETAARILAEAYKSATKPRETQTLWQPPQTAPKNQLILANTGYPWPVLAHWCEVSEKWATSILNEDLAAGDKIDVWFETEYEDEKALVGWMPLPAFTNRPKTGQAQGAKK